MNLPDIRASIRAVLVSANLTDSSSTSLSLNQIVIGWIPQDIYGSLGQTNYPLVAITPISTVSDWLSIGGTKKINRTKIAIDVFTKDVSTAPNKGHFDQWTVTTQIVNAINAAQFTQYSTQNIFWMQVLEQFKDISMPEVVPTLYRNRITVLAVWLETYSASAPFG